MRTVTADVAAWITNETTSPEFLLTGEPADVIGTLYFHNFDGCIPDGWVKAGDATVTLTLVGERELINNKAAKLRVEINKVQADAEIRINELKGKLQNLLAITCQPESE